MTVFTYSQARQKFSKVLDIARREGSVRIKRKDGQIFSISPVRKLTRSPLSIKGIKTKATTRDIITAVRESRRR
jgi:antitoxin (DNA-binding transcriptional repressor) of toxin-antitoxin stability system